MNKQLLFLFKKKKLARNKILLEKWASNLKSSPRSLEDAFNTHVALVCHTTLLMYLMEEGRVTSAVLLPSHPPPLPRSPHAGTLADRKQRPMPPSLTDFAAFSTLGSQARITSEPGSCPCLAPYPKQASSKTGTGGEDSPEGRGRGSYSPPTRSWHWL